MPPVSDFHSVNEAKKAVDKRVYHNNSTCPAGRDIPAHERKPGKGGYRLCDDCERQNRAGR